MLSGKWQHDGSMEPLSILGGICNPSELLSLIIYFTFHYEMLNEVCIQIKAEFDSKIKNCKIEDDR